MMRQIKGSDTKPDAKFRVYAIADRSSMDSSLKSNPFEELGCIEVNNLIAVIDSNPVDKIGGDFTPEQLNAFSDRMNDLHRAIDILPFRFANPASANEIIALLRSHQESYSNCLMRIAGCTEVNARWAVADSNALGAHLDSEDIKERSKSGSDYLRAKHRTQVLEKQSEIELKSIAESIGLQDGIQCIESRSSVRRMRCDVYHSVLVFGVEVLLRRADATPYLSLLSKGLFRSCLPTCTSGPWPPYSFIGDVNFALTQAPFSASATTEPVQKCAIFPAAEAAS